MGYANQEHLTHHKCPHCEYEGDDFLTKQVGKTQRKKIYGEWEYAAEWAYLCPVCDYAWGEMDSTI
jgi:hypothetical protein